MSDQLEDVLSSAPSIFATAQATHPAGVVLDADGNPALDADGQPIYEEKS